MVAGELHLGGPKVARGYIGRPDLTAASFLTLPASHQLPPAAGRVYRTGDLVRWLPDGNLVFLGRVDFQVKLNGQRIETQEIEAVVRQVPGVQDALVTVCKTPAGVPRLVAYCVVGEAGAAGGEAAALGEEAKRACTEQLPGYMVPSLVVALEAWPLNSSGKVDRKALPAPDWGSSAQEYVAPSGELEDGEGGRRGGGVPGGGAAGGPGQLV